MHSANVERRRKEEGRERRRGSQREGVGGKLISRAQSHSKDIMSSKLNDPSARSLTRKFH